MRFLLSAWAAAVCLVSGTLEPLTAEKEDFFGANRSVKVTVSLDTAGLLTGEARFTNQSAMALCAQVVVAFFEGTTRRGGQRVAKSCVNGVPADDSGVTQVQRLVQASGQISSDDRAKTTKIKVRATNDTGAAVNAALLNRLFP